MLLVIGRQGHVRMEHIEMRGASPTTEHAAWPQQARSPAPDTSHPPHSTRARLERRLTTANRAHDRLPALLMLRGAVPAVDMSTAERLRASTGADLGEVLLARGFVSEPDLIAAQAECHGLGQVDLSLSRPDPALARYLDPHDALALHCVPIRRAGPILVVATSRPENAEAIRAATMAQADRLAILPGSGPVSALPSAWQRDLHTVVTLAPRAQITMAQVALYGQSLARTAEGQAPRNSSCRTWRAAMAKRWALLLAICIVLSAMVFPNILTAVLFSVALLVFAGNMTLKIAAFAAARRAKQTLVTSPDPAPLTRQPVVSLLVQLYREQDIAATLVSHLSRLDYPPELLDVLLITELDDTTTHKALADTCLPPTWRVLTVPPGTPRTKPRALNFALPFARGEIIGVYDAEDRPEPDQIDKVARRFATCPPDVACLQGRLDYFNARHNLLSRLFALEYASWFRVMLPGVQHMGLVVPLGGTTQFLRRDVLIAVGCWDAHNVTEDAELGLRLARSGYRTEILETTTYEEANAAILPWIRQRARWQKGYLMTWATAMRAPRSLWRDLGPIRFLALQVQILGAVAGFLVAPLLWSLMIKPFGQAHPLDAIVGPTGYGVLGTAFVASSVLSIAVALQATAAPHLRHLRPAILLIELYFLLATLSAWKALADMIWRPFLWDKTEHGKFGGAAAPDPDLTPRPSAPLPSDAPRRRSTGDP